MTCSIEGCNSTEGLRRGLCQTHYMRQRRAGSPYTVRKPGPSGAKSKHFMYGAWAAMVNRCHNPKNSSYGRYGALGISVCQRWRDDFSNFLADVGERPTGKTLDRIDPTGNYEPTNCRWATPAQQRMNLSPEGEARGRRINSEKKAQYWAERRRSDAA